MDVNRLIADRAGAGEPFAVAMVLSAEGSTPQGPGVKALIDATGTIHGTVGGGAPEGEVVRRAPDVLAAGRPEVLELELQGADAHSDAPICGGCMRILIDPTAGANADAYRQAALALQERRRGVLTTVVAHAPGPATTVHWVREEDVDAAPDFPGAEAVGRCLAKETAELIVDEEGGREALVEPVIPRPLLLIAGGGHIGQALARLAEFAGFEVTVIDDRPEFAAPALFPEGVRTICRDVADALGSAEIGGDTFVVIVTRGHRHDAEALAATIRSPAAYVGMIGSRRKVGLLRQEFVESGTATAEEFDRVFAPIGLDVGAVTVPEIATSILAQLVAVRRKGRQLGGTGAMPRQ